MKTLNLRDAKAHLSSVIDGVEKTGEFVTVTRHGKPAALLVPIAALDMLVPHARRNLGDHFLRIPGALDLMRNPSPMRETEL